MRHKLGLILGVFLIAALLTTLSFTSLAAGNKPQTFRFTIYSDPITLDPALSNDSSGTEIMDGLFEGLVVTGKQGDIKPGMAKSWKVSPDGRVYTFKLRPDAVWSNGSRVTASDFEYAWKRALDPETGSSMAYLMFPISGAEQYHKGLAADAAKVGVRALNGDTLQVTLADRTPSFLDLVTAKVFLPVPQKVVQRNPRWTESAATLVSNGPFVLSESKPGRYILSKSSRYYGQHAVKLAKVQITVNNDPDKEIALFRSGQVDWSNFGLGPQMFEPSDPLRKEVRRTGIAGTYYYAINVSVPPLNNVNIRKALAMAVPRSSFSGSIPAYGFVPPRIKGAVQSFREEAGNKAYFSDDAKLAAKLLKKGMQEEGLTEFPELELLVNDNFEATYMAEVITAGWQKTLGIEVWPWTVTFEELIEDRKSLNYSIASAGWGADYNDPASFLELYASWSEENDSGWSSPAYDDLIMKGRHTADPAARTALYRQAEAMLMDQMVIIPIHYMQRYYLQKPSVHGVYYNYSGRLNYRGGSIQ